jgi:hypothetical protein
MTCMTKEWQEPAKVARWAAQKWKFLQTKEGNVSPPRTNDPVNALGTSNSFWGHQWPFVYHNVPSCSGWHKEKQSQAWWLAPVILATQEAEIRGIAVQNQPRQIVHETLSWKRPSHKKGWWSGSRCGPWVQIQYQKKKEKHPELSAWPKWPGGWWPHCNSLCMVPHLGRWPPHLQRALN